MTVEAVAVQMNGLGSRLFRACSMFKDGPDELLEVAYRSIEALGCEEPSCRERNGPKPTSGPFVIGLTLPG